MCAGIVRVARPTESGIALVLGAVKAAPSAGGATVTTVRTASQGDAARGLRVDRPHPAQLGRLTI
jgi:hypothetical protein